MTRFLELPNAEAIAAAALRAASIPNVGARVYSSIPKEPTFPLIVVRRIGGAAAVRQYLDAANLQVDVWGGSKAEALAAANRARVVLLELEGTAISSPVSAWVSGVDDALGLTWQPDPDTGRDRYLFGVLLYARST